MKLYDLERGDNFKVIDQETKVPPAAPQPADNVTYKYTHVDGMYAPCEGTDGERYYFAAWTEVEKVWKLASIVHLGSKVSFFTGAKCGLTTAMYTQATALVHY